MATNNTSITSVNYFCDKCNFKCIKKGDYNRHLHTRKHTSSTNQHPITSHQCNNCNKEYQDRSGLWRHTKVCKGTPKPIKDNTADVPSDTIPQNPPVDMTMVFELLKQNQEFKDLMMEQAKQLALQNLQMSQQNQFIIEAVKDGKIGNNSTNTNCHNTTNNKFNLNVFLNETCKDAITMNEFVNSIEVSMEDFVETGKLGFVDGISKVIMERMQGMEMHTRPMHCTDLKRETLYIKNDDAWEKGDQDKTLLRRAVKNVASKNYRQLKPWYQSAQPQVDQNGTQEYEDYFQYYKAALGGCGKDEDKKFEDKIMRNIIKRVVVDKDTITV